MQVDEVLKVLEMASKTGVSSLKFENLEVSFGQWPKWKGDLDKDKEPLQLDGVKDSARAEPDRAEQSMADLLLNDPVSYEEQMARGEM